MNPRRERADAQRNREAVLAAADRLFAGSTAPGSVSMDDVATAAGVGKGTLFRRFGDRDGLVRALMEKRAAPLREAVTEGPPPLGPRTPARERVPALMAALLRFKLDNRHLALALESGGGNSPYRAGHYTWWHALLRDAVREIPGAPDADFTAHALLAAVRADLVEYLADGEGTPPERLEGRLAAFVAKVLA
ncbi:TetR/AcrR family transcriptional regulator [Nocardiopsis sp. NPDC058631]|uniref:TetR/AcrR family transcriptional regulator n=1 Tax=Nocardiopsis sp. NPDC058631 TaxID=3346566 RepID=UPI00365329C4